MAFVGLTPQYQEGQYIFCQTTSQYYRYENRLLRPLTRDVWLALGSPTVLNVMNCPAGITIPLGSPIPDPTVTPPPVVIPPTNGNGGVGTGGNGFDGGFDGGVGQTGAPLNQPPSSQPPSQPPSQQSGFPTWAWILIAIVGFLILAGIVGLIIWLVLRNRNKKPTGMPTLI